MRPSQCSGSAADSQEGKELSSLSIVSIDYNTVHHWADVFATLTCEVFLVMSMVPFPEGRLLCLVLY